MFSVRKFTSLALIALGCLLAIDRVRADNVNLVGGLNVIWDIKDNPTQSPSVAIQIENATNSSDLIFNGYDLGLKLEPVLGSGSIAVGTTTNPSSNSIVPAWYDTPGPNMSIIGSTYVMGNSAFDSTDDYLVPDTPTDLVTLDFEPGGVAPSIGSVFDIVSDHTWSDYVDHLGNSTSYTNNTSSDFVLGTITVVPEPTSLVLLSVALAGIAIGYARRLAPLVHGLR